MDSVTAEDMFARPMAKHSLSPRLEAGVTILFCGMLRCDTAILKSPAHPPDSASTWPAMMSFWISLVPS